VKLRVHWHGSGQGFLDSFPGGLVGEKEIDADSGEEDEATESGEQGADREEVPLGEAGAPPPAIAEPAVKSVKVPLLGIVRQETESDDQSTDGGRNPDDLEAHGQ